MTWPVSPLADGISEDVFLQRIVDECAWRRLKCHHETDSRRTRRGWPDVAIAGPGGLVIAELKSARGRVTTEQQGWLDVLQLAGVEVYVWRPADWPEVTRVLQRLARPRPTPTREET